MINPSDTRPRLRRLGDSTQCAFCCPCGETHVVDVGPGGWGYNGDAVRPTLRPSVLARGVIDGTATPYVCHSYITDGQIQFFGDCTHALAGKTVDLLPWDESIAVS